MAEAAAAKLGRPCPGLVLKGCSSSQWKRRGQAELQAHKVMELVTCCAVDTTRRLNSVPEDKGMLLQGTDLSLHSGLQVQLG